MERTLGDLPRRTGRGRVRPAGPCSGCSSSADGSGAYAGVVLAYAWAGYHSLSTRSARTATTSLVAMLVVLALRIVSSATATAPARRECVVRRWRPTKFAAAGPGPLSSGTGRWHPKRAAALYIAAFGSPAAVVMLPVVAERHWHAFWHDSVVYQARRGSPFSIWGLWGGTRPEQHLARGPPGLGSRSRSSRAGAAARSRWRRSERRC